MTRTRDQYSVSPTRDKTPEPLEGSVAWIARSPKGSNNLFSGHKVSWRDESPSDVLSNVLKGQWIAVAFFMSVGAFCPPKRSRKRVSLYQSEEGAVVPTNKQPPTMDIGILLLTSSELLVLPKRRSPEFAWPSFKKFSLSIREWMAIRVSGRHDATNKNRVGTGRHPGLDNALEVSRASVDKRRFRNSDAMSN